MNPLYNNYVTFSVQLSTKGFIWKKRIKKYKQLSVNTNALTHKVIIVIAEWTIP